LKETKLVKHIPTWKHAVEPGYSNNLVMAYLQCSTIVLGLGGKHVYDQENLHCVGFRKVDNMIVATITMKDGTVITRACENGVFNYRDVDQVLILDDDDDDDDLNESGV